ncbi:MAG: CoxE, partial [Chloroflexus aggregans]
MDRRITEFIAGLRAAGVRISVAESADALRAIEQAGISDRNIFRLALQTALIKERQDQAIFNELFPLYFGKDSPPPLQQAGGGQLSPEEQQQLMRQLQQILAQFPPGPLSQLFQSMVSGQPLSNQQIRAML